MDRPGRGDGSSACSPTTPGSAWRGMRTPAIPRPSRRPAATAFACRCSRGRGGGPTEDPPPGGPGDGHGGFGGGRVGEEGKTRWAADHLKKKKKNITYCCVRSEM